MRIPSLVVRTIASGMAYVMAWLGLAGAVAAQESWSITPDQLSCIVDNHAAYLEQEGDPIVIVIVACPEPDPARAMSAASRNSGLFKLNDGDAVIVLSKDELGCLVAQAAALSTADRVDIPKEGLCEQAAERQ